MRAFCAALALFSLSLSGCTGQGKPEPTVEDIAPQTIAPTADPVNQQADSSIDVLVLTLMIDSAAIRLERVVLARVPRSAVTTDTLARGDRVVVVGFAAGARVSSVSVSDAVLNVQEGVGLVRQIRRQVVVSLPAPRALNTVEVTAAATGATARLDVRAAYAPYCRVYSRENPYCPSPG